MTIPHYASFHNPSTNPYYDLLPPGSEFFRHPFATTKQYVEVFKLHTQHISQETAARRQSQNDDVQKRKEYRKAHGIRGPQLPFGLGSDPQPAPAKMVGEIGEAQTVREDEVGPASDVVGMGAKEPEQVYTDFEGKKRPVKKWLGIW